MKKEVKTLDQFREGSQVKVLDFSITMANKEFHLGLNIQKIKEVLEYQKLQNLPESYKPFVGLLNLRNTPIPLIRLDSFFSKHISGCDMPDLLGEHCRIIICEFQRLLVGIVVEKTGKIHTLDNSQIKPVPDALNFTEHKVFNGLVQLGDQFYNLLDIEYILDSLKVPIAETSHVNKKNLYQGYRVLLVEDSKLFQKKLIRCFQEMGLEVVLAENGVEGLEKLEFHNYQFDFIFTDIEMPLLNGIGMARKIKAIPQAQNIPLIFNTSISNSSLVKDITDEKLGQYFVKYDEVEIQHTLHRLLSGLVKVA